MLSLDNVIVTRDSWRSLWYYSLGLIHPTLEEFKNVGFTSVSVDETRVENEALWFHCLTIVPTQIQNELTDDCICCVFKFLLLSESSVMTENNWCVFRVKTKFSNFSGVVCTEDIWCVFKVKTPVSNFSGVEWTGPSTHLSRDPPGHQARERNIGKQSHTLYHSCLHNHLTQSPAELRSHHGQLQTSEHSSWLGSLGRGFPNPLC